MFEKEAEEYSNNWKLNKNNDLNFAELVELRAVIYKANKDGAEFGYNKAKKEMQEQGLALQSDMDKTIKQNIQLKKQNNWLEGCKLELAEHLGKANDKISELEQQIEKMKCCGNCMYFDRDEPRYCNKGVFNAYICDKWRFAND